MKKDEFRDSKGRFMHKHRLTEEQEKRRAKNISNSLKGHKHSPITKEKISMSQIKSYKDGRRLSGCAELSHEGDFSKGKNNPRYKYDKSNPPLCKCGCGQKTKFCYMKKGFRNFVWGHSSKGKLNPFYGKKHSIETISKIRERSKNDKIAHKKISITRIKLFAEGKLIPYYKGKHLPNRTKEKIKNRLKILYLENKLAKNIGGKGENNPMSNPEIVKKAISKLNYKEIGKKGKETRRKLLKEGKIITCSETRKKLFAEGKLKSPMEGKTHSEKTKEKLRINHLNPPEKIRKLIREARARQILPLKDTSIEIKIQNFLKQLGINFLTHQHISQITHSYQCDILIPSMKLVIECDGDYWHKYPIGREIDYIRTSELLQKGFKVLRLWESEIKDLNIDGFKQKIMELK